MKGYEIILSIVDTSTVIGVGPNSNLLELLSKNLEHAQALQRDISERADILGTTFRFVKNSPYFESHLKLFHYQQMHEYMTWTLKSDWEYLRWIFRSCETADIFATKEYSDYHSIADSLFNSEALSKAEGLIKEIRIEMIKYHRDGITNWDSYRVNSMGESILKTHAGEFKKAWTVAKFEWNNVHRLKYPLTGIN
uniref:hypothetical protein n=1 Tax=Dematophora necatrix TaxID=2751867 RepID=UPI0030E18E36